MALSPKNKHNPAHARRAGSIGLACIDRVDLFVVDDATDQVVMRTCKPASKNPMWKLDASLRNSKLVNQALMDRLVQFLKNAAAQHAQSLGDDALFDL